MSGVAALTGGALKKATGVARMKHGVRVQCELADRESQRCTAVVVTSQIIFL